MLFMPRFVLPFTAGILAALSLAAVDFVPIRAVITTVRDDCRFRPAEGKPTRLGLHDMVNPTEGTWTTSAGGRVSLGLSNGLGLALYGSTTVEFERGSQTPFAEAQESLAIEPSASGVRLRLVHGAIALAHPEPSALSEIRVQTPTGEFRFHRGRAIVTVDVSGARVFVEEGAGTFVFPGETGRELMASGSAILVTPYSASRGTATSRDAAVPTLEGWSQLGPAAQGARDRILHLAPEDGRAETFLLLAPATKPETEASDEAAEEDSA